MHLCIHITQGLSSSKKWEENFAMHFVVSVSMMRPLQRKSGSSAAQSLTLRFACFMRGRVNELRPGRMDLEQANLQAPLKEKEIITHLARYERLC